MAFIETVAPGGGGGGGSFPTLTLLGGSRSVQTATYTFTQSYSNICVITSSDSATFASITPPQGSTCTEVGTVLTTSFSSAKEMRIFDIHNVASGTTITVNWNQWCNLYVFTY